MNWYKDNKDAWKEIIETVAAERHRSTQMVEKDMQDRDSRHLYDIAKLLPNIVMNDELDALIDRVREDRMQSKNNPSAQLEHNIPEMLREIIRSRFYEHDYNELTKRLLYEQMSYDEAIERGIAVIAGLDIFEYKVKR